MCFYKLSPQRSLTRLVYDTAPVEKKTICSFDMDAISAGTFKDAVKNIYWFEFFMGEFRSNLVGWMEALGRGDRSKVL